MNIKLEKAIELLEKCSAVIVDNVVSYPSVEKDIYPNDDNQFLQVKWTDEEGQDFCVTFEEGPNKEVKIIGSSMFLVDTDDEETQVSLLQPWYFEGEIQEELDEEQRRDEKNGLYPDKWDDAN